MIATFDLISDLYLTKDTPFSWNHYPTSLCCIVAGNISDDREVLKATLRHLGECYSAVFFIDGPLEHARSLSDLSGSYSSLIDDLTDIPNVIYLQNHVIIVNTTAILATNGWWSLDFAPNSDLTQTTQWVVDAYGIPTFAVDTIMASAISDANYMVHSLSKLQRHVDVKNIITVTSSVPNYKLIGHDLSLAGTHQANLLGNSYLSYIQKADTEKKMTTWCFGSYLGNIDMDIDGIRFVNNSRGDKDLAVYYPLRVALTPE